MNPSYTVHDTASVYSPGLLFFKDLIRQNVARSIEIAGSPARMRPHVKTHKTRELVRLELDAGIMKHKCATLAEAEMLADCGVPAGEIVYVGDRLDNDILPAQSIGMRAVFIRRGPWGYVHAQWKEMSQVQYRIDSLDQLAGVLREIDGGR